MTSNAKLSNKGALVLAFLNDKEEMIGMVQVLNGLGMRSIGLGSVKKEDQMQLLTFKNQFDAEEYLKKFKELGVGEFMKKNMTVDLLNEKGKINTDKLVIQSNPFVFNQ